MIVLKFTKAEMMRLPNIGMKTVRNLEEFFAKHGYTFPTREDIDLERAAHVLREAGYKVEPNN